MTLEDLFKQWQELNNKVNESFGEFNFDSIKKIRAEQRKIEDTIYKILIENAPKDIQKIIPSDCGEMEIGFDLENEIFYYVMFDPEEGEESENTSLIAITIDNEKKVGIIKNFEMPE